MTSILNLPMAETVTILHRTATTDAYGSDAWTTASTSDVAAAVIPRVPTAGSASAGLPRPGEAGGFAISEQGEFTVASGYDLYLPAGTNVAVTDHVMIRGTEYAIDGEPAAWTSPLTRAGFVQLGCSRIDG